MKKTGYENLDVRAADAVIIKRYAQRCGVKIVDAVHSIARLLDRAVREKRALASDDFAGTIPPDLRAPALQSEIARRTTGTGQRLRQGKLLSQEYDHISGKVKMKYWSEKGDSR